LVADAQTLTANLIVPSTLKLNILKSGSIVKDSTYTLTINGNFEAGIYTVFTGFSVGDVSFATGMIDRIIPQWWGAESADDTLILNHAITAANEIDSGATPALVYLPSGLYETDHNTLPAIECNFDGADASIQGLTDDNGYVLQFDDNANGRYLKLLGIYGKNFPGSHTVAANQKGIGFQVVRAEHSNITIQKLEGLYIGLDMAGDINEGHIGEVNFAANSVLHNNYGIVLTAGDSQCESSNYYVNYLQNCLYAVYLDNKGSGGNSLCVNNLIDILVIENNSPDASYGFYLTGDVGAQTAANTIIVRENITNPTVSGGVIGGTAVGANYFKLSNFDFSEIDATIGAQIYDGSMEHNHPGDTAYKARTVIHGAAPPTAGYHQKGSITWNNNSSVGDPLGWNCTTAGSPGTWTAFGPIGTALTSSAAITNTAIVIGDGGGRGTKTTGIGVDGSDNVGGVGTLGMDGDLTMDKTSNALITIKSTNVDGYSTLRLENDAQAFETQIRSDVSDAYVIRDSTANANRFSIDTSGNSSTLGHTLYTGNTQPVTDDTYYVGKNDDDSPRAYKGVVLKDTTDGKYYRYESVNGVLTAVDLTD
ncbi:hypothetical protein KAR91_66770, partial [Candidatus Pacearchaeota archaeon]|nr:hypothetical protein [Candidatus Pacearchaeota archaeon]